MEDPALKAIDIEMLFQLGEQEIQEFTKAMAESIAAVHATPQLQGASEEDLRTVLWTSVLTRYANRKRTNGKASRENAFRAFAAMMLLEGSNSSLIKSPTLREAIDEMRIFAEHKTQGFIVIESTYKRE